MTFIGKLLSRVGGAFRALWQALFWRRGPTRDAIEPTGRAGLLEASEAPVVDATFEEVDSEKPRQEQRRPRADEQARREADAAREREEQQRQAEQRRRLAAACKARAAEERHRVRQEAKEAKRQRQEKERRAREAAKQADKERRRGEKEAAKQRHEEMRAVAQWAHSAARRDAERQIVADFAGRLESEVETTQRELRDAAERRAALEIPSDYVPAAESEHEMHQISVTQFAGPLDLLLFLIRRHEIDIFDIPIAFICERYLEYVEMMQELNIDVASEFMYMAAELLHIKSKMLLPRPVEVDADEEEVDPRAELVRRLLEYQKYKNAAMHFAGSDWLDRDVFEREPEKMDLGRREAPLKEVGIFALIESFDAVLKRQRSELKHQVMLEGVSVAERIRLFVEVLVGQQMVRFEELIGEMSGRLDVVVSFLALLEMTKFQLLKLYQSAEGVLYVSPRFESVDTATRHLEERLVDDEAQYA